MYAASIMAHIQSCITFFQLYTKHLKEAETVCKTVWATMMANAVIEW